MRRFYLWVFLAALLHGGFFLLPVVEKFGQTESLQALAEQTPQNRTTLIRIEAKPVIDSAPKKQGIDKTRQVNPKISTASALKSAQPSVTPPVPKRSVPKAAIESIQRLTPKPLPTDTLLSQEDIVRQVDGALSTTQSEVNKQVSPIRKEGEQVDTVTSVETARKAEIKEGMARVIAKPISTRKPKYPRRAIVRNQQGSVSVELVISEEGLVERAKLLKSSGYELLDRSVMRFVDKERFFAALEEGHPIASTQLFTFRFVLN